jgi:DNA-directed RNA polymerase specialized sigma24 family protein
MSSRGSVTHWISLLKAGEHAAAQPLWEAYCRRLAGLARRKLQAAPRRASDEEDVALSAFDSLCRGAGQGHFPQLRDRNDLWHLLVVITARKALQLARHECRQKRGGGKVINDAELGAVVGQEPTPDFAAQVAEECRRLLDQLGDDQLRQIAVWKMEGHTNEEIASKLGCVARTVERRLEVIRTQWSGEDLT